MENVGRKNLITNITENTLLGLIRQSIWGTPEEFCPDSDWDSVFSEANLQAITALAAKVLPTSLTDAQLRKWNQAEAAQMARYLRYLFAQDELCALFSEASIPMVILKGTAASLYYPEPFRRTLGDIDFLVPQELFLKAMETMIKAGYQRDRNEHDGERHIGFRKDGIEYELHHHFSFDALNVESSFIDGVAHSEIGMVDGHSFPMMPKLENGVVLLTHMRSHLRSGLGLRQVIDWMMYVDRILDDDFWGSDFCDVVTSANLDTLAITATRTCQLYLGLPETISWCRHADEKLCEALMENILSSGNFGVKNGKGMVVESAFMRFKTKGVFQFLQSAGEYNWNAYHRYHWLKPFCWLYQICRYVHHGFKSGRKGIDWVSDYRRSNSRYDLLTRLGID